jgi:tRNA (adenine57-N1/adenine58-N1)-methyltransferase
MTESTTQPSSTLLPEPVGAANRRGPFRVGERVQLTDERGRMNTITLEEGGSTPTRVSSTTM